MLLRSLEIYVSFLYNPYYNVFTICVSNVLFANNYLQLFDVFISMFIKLFCLCAVRFVWKTIVLTTGWFGEFAVIQTNHT